MVVVGFLVVLSSGCLYSSTSLPPQACFGEDCFFIEIADTSEERALGLMGRESLSANQGMLFVFESESIHGFWMKNTLISLDAIWINAQNQVVDVKTMVPCEKDPCHVYNPNGSSLFVLEINAGLANEYTIQPGDVVHISGV